MAGTQTQLVNSSGVTVFEGSQVGGGGSQPFTLIRKFFPVSAADIAAVWDGEGNTGQVTIWTPSEGDAIVGPVDVRVPLGWAPGAYLASVKTAGGAWSAGPDYDITQQDTVSDGWAFTGSSDGSTPPGGGASYATDVADPIIFQVFNDANIPETGSAIISFTAAVAAT